MYICTYMCVQVYDTFFDVILGFTVYSIKNGCSTNVVKIKALPLQMNVTHVFQGSLVRSWRKLSDMNAGLGTSSPQCW